MQKAGVSRFFAFDFRDFMIVVFIFKIQRISRSEIFSWLSVVNN